MSAAAQHGPINGTKTGAGMLEAITAIREQLWSEGFRPLMILPWDHPDQERAGKAPLGRGWEGRARRDPPEAVTLPAVPHAPNTGVLCDGLRAVDIDIDDFELAGRVRALALDMLGSTIIRCRSNSGRCLLPYRAAEGEPPKRTLPGQLGKVEVLGRGQQFVSHGTHKSGAELYWSPEPPEEFGRDALPAVSEEQITRFLRAVAPLIEADPAKAEDPARERDRERRTHDATDRADVLDVIAALAAIRNEGAADWEHWNSVGMAAWAASGGSEHAFAAWRAWSAQHPTHDDAACRARWDHYFTSPPTQTGAGKLYALAHDAIPGWRRPSETRGRAKQRQDQAEPPPRTEVPEREEARPKEAREPIWLDSDAWTEAEIPHRPWIVGNYLLRGAVTLVAGPPSVMKSSLALLWATACALKRSVGKFNPINASASLIYNTEDDQLEQRRRLSATLRQFGARPADIHDKIHRVGPTTVGTLFTRDEEGEIRRTPAMNELASLIAALKPDVLVVDPFSELHNVQENDNTAMRAIVAEFRGMAVRHNMAVLVLHHTTKGANLGVGDPDVARGASAIIGAVRAAFTLLPMSEADAEALGVKKDTKTRRRYIRLDSAKSNYAPLQDAEWFEKVEYLLDNNEAVAAMVPWTPPNAKSPSQDDLNALIVAIQAGSPHPDARGLPFSPKLAPGERSLLPLLEQRGFIGEESHRSVLEALKAQGMEKRDFRDPGRRARAKGYRIGGLPAASWYEDAAGSADG